MKYKILLLTYFFICLIKMCEFGYMYCISNSAMPGLYKVGFTTRDPEERLKEANSHDTWKPPCPYVIEFARSVSDVREKERTSHRILADFRVSERQEFFRHDISRIRLMFELMDGEWWNNMPPRPRSNPANEDNDNASIISASSRATRKLLRDYLVDSQKIRHILSGDILIATYNSKLDRLCIGTIYLKTIHEFVHHHEGITKTKASTKSHWKQCECNIGDDWKVMDDIIPIKR
jgi:hypothetical protein